MSKANRLGNASFTKEEVQQLINDGVINKDFLQLKVGFNNKYDVSEDTPTEMTSFKTKKKFEMPAFLFSNDEGRVTVWGSTLFNALVMPDGYDIKIDKIKKADGLPVYFSDDFYKEFPNLKKVSDHRDKDGGVPIYDKYEIIGAIVTRSRVENDRWAVSYKSYEKGRLFLEFEKAKRADSSITWITEERIIEISKLSEEDRTFESIAGVVTLPSYNDLAVVGSADENVRWARARFLLRKTW